MKKLLTALLMTAALTAQADDSALKTKLAGFGMQNVQLQDSPIKGIKTVVSDQGVFYASEDGKYVFEGKLFEMTNSGAKDVAGGILLDKLNSYKNEMIVYPAKNEKYVVTVFMDITCHYCHLLHQQLKEYNDLGITVRYLAFPRGGMKAESAKQMEAIWTAKDPAFALNEAEAGRLPKEIKTPSIVRKHYQLGVQFGVTGTPSIVLPNGELIGGYLKPADLLAALKETQ